MTVPVLLGGGKVYMIKQTVYDHGDIGKVAVFGKDGLEAEFFLGKAEELPETLRKQVTESSYIDQQAGVVGVLRTYQPNDKLEREERIVSPDEIGLYRVILQAHSAMAPTSCTGGS